MPLCVIAQDFLSRWSEFDTAQAKLSAQIKCATRPVSLWSVRQLISIYLTPGGLRPTECSCSPNLKLRLDVDAADSLTTSVLSHAHELPSLTAKSALDRMYDSQYQPFSSCLCVTTSGAIQRFNGPILLMLTASLALYSALPAVHLHMQPERFNLSRERRTSTPHTCMQRLKASTG